MAVNARKQRVLAIAALALTIILLISFTHSTASSLSTSEYDGNRNANELVRDKSGVIDESKVKLAEENSKIVIKSEAQLHRDSDVSVDKVKGKSNMDGGAKNNNGKNRKYSSDQIVGESVVSGNIAQIVDTDTGLTDSGKGKAKSDSANVAAKNGGGKKISSSSSSKKENIDTNDETKVDLSKLKDSSEGSSDSKDSINSFNPAKEFKEILSLSPVVIFSKSYCPYSKTLKNLLKTSYSISPEPAIVELDLHSNGKELQNYIGEQSGRGTVPNLFINGISRGGCDETTSLHNKNELLDKLLSWGGSNIKVSKINAPSNH